MLRKTRNGQVSVSSHVCLSYTLVFFPGSISSIFCCCCFSFLHCLLKGGINSNATGGGWKCIQALLQNCCQKDFKKVVVVLGIIIKFTVGYCAGLDTLLILYLLNVKNHHSIIEPMM